MNPERWEKIQELFHAALARPDSERGRFVQGEAGDEEIARIVLQMVSAAEASRQLPETMSPIEALRVMGVAGPEEHAEEGDKLGSGSLLGDFLLGREIGRGGMGAVFVARQQSLGRMVAVKVLPIHLLTKIDTVLRFEREGRIVAQLHHPAIISIFAVGETGSSRYIAMEYIAEGDLGRELARQRRGEDGCLLPSVSDRGHAACCAELIANVADGVQHAHDRGVIHRDIKPQNLLLSAERRLKLADFGLARDLRQGSLTEDGAILGTLAYMSPEQASRTRITLDERTDVYSLGAVLYELLTLEPAFTAETQADLLNRIAVSRPAPVRRLNRRIPSDLSVICDCAMSKDRRGRYASAKALADDLRRFLNHESIVARPPGPVSLMVRHARLRWRAYTAAIAVVLGAVALTSWMRVRESRAERAREFDACAAIVDGDLWWSMGAQERSRMILQVEALERDKRRLTTARLIELQTFVEYLDRAAAKMRDDALAQIDAGYSTPRGIEPVDSEAIEQGVLQLAEVEHLFGWPTHMGSDGVLDALRATIHIRVHDEDGTLIPSRVTLVELDPHITTPRMSVDLGMTPIEGHRVRDGHYRIVVESAGHRSREFTRVVDRNRRLVEIDIVLGRTSEVALDMVRVDGGAMRFAAQGPSAPWRGAEYAVDTFWVQRGTVTVGDYRAFLRASDGPIPSFWRSLPDESADLWSRLLSGEFDDRPMTGITFGEAQAFAEWHGLRLMTLLERHYVAFGGGGGRTPGDLGRADELFAGFPEVRSPGGSRPNELAEEYFANALPSIGSDPRPDPKTGVELLLGNIWEWTETLGYATAASGFRSQPNHRIVAGCSWRQRTDSSTNHRSSRVFGDGQDYAQPMIGFRCATSFAP